MDEFPKRVRAVYNKQLGLFSITALDGAKCGKVIDYYEDVCLGAPISYPKSDKAGPYAPVVGEWLPSPVGSRVRLSLADGRSEPEVEHMPDDDTVPHVA